MVKMKKAMNKDVTSDEKRRGSQLYYFLYICRLKLLKMNEIKVWIEPMTPEEFAGVQKPLTITTASSPPLSGVYWWHPQPRASVS